MQSLSTLGRRALDLQCLAYLLTGRRERSIDIAAEVAAAQDVASQYFTKWMTAWSRRVVIAKALTAIRVELAASARRTEEKRPERTALPGREWSLHPGTTKAELEAALLAMDLFPRVALLLSIFERVPVADAAILLDTDADLVRKGVTLGLRELTRTLARMQGWKSKRGEFCVGANETLYA